MMASSSNKYLYALAVAILVALGFYLYVRPLPAASAVLQLPTPPKTTDIQLPWPATGQAALGAIGYGLLAQNNASAPVPIGSTAKVITALAVLKQKPIAPGSQGPILTLTDNDVALFNQYYSQDGSVTKVSAGEQITELQSLEAMLLPSSNNMADSLADWAFGSVNSYISYANKMVKSLGLTETTVGDTNGFSDSTTSTASDLVKLGLVAINNPIIASVVGQTVAQIPVEGTINNINFLLDQDGVIGIKTGSTAKAGGCYIFAAQHTILGRKITMVGAILSQPTLTDAVNAAKPILDAIDSGFQRITVLTKGQVLGHYKAAWGAQASFVTTNGLSLIAWKGADIRLISQPDSVQTAKAGDKVGEISAVSSDQSVSSSLIMTQSLPSPSPVWRLFR